MQKLDIRKKRRSSWPWLAGAVLVAFTGWGVTALLRADEPDQSLDAVSDSLAGLAEPAAIPLPSLAPYRGSSSPSLADLAPLDSADVRKQAHATGEVVATGSDGFWILADAHVIRVDSDRRVRRGDTVTVEGRLQRADSARNEQIAAAVLERNPAFEEWTVIRDLKLVANPTVADSTGRRRKRARAQSPGS